MKKVLLFNPGISSLNRGDEIISEGIKSNIEYLLDNNFVTKISSFLLHLIY